MKKNSCEEKFAKTGPGIDKDRAPGAPTVSDYRKAAASVKYLLDLIVDAMERKHKVGHRALTMDDTLLESGEFVHDYWAIPECKPRVGEKFVMHQASCCGVSPAIESVRELVDFVLDAIDLRSLRINGNLAMFLIVPGLDFPGLDPGFTSREHFHEAKFDDPVGDNI